MKTVYEWREGCRIGGDPQEIGQEIAALGEATAERVVDAAKRRGSPLHSLFEWDDSAAANAHRLETARLIMRGLVITIEVEETKEPLVVRAFEAVTVNPGEPKAYLPTMKVLGQKDWREEVVSRLRGDLVATKKQIDAYAYLSNQIAVAGKHVDRAIRQLQHAA